MRFEASTAVSWHYCSQIFLKTHVALHLQALTAAKQDALPTESSNQSHVQQSAPEVGS